VIIGAVAAECQHAGLDAHVEEELRGIAMIAAAAERLGFLDRRHEIIRIRQNLRNGRQVLRAAGKDVDGGDGSSCLGGLHDHRGLALVHSIHQADATGMENLGVGGARDHRVVDEEIARGAFHVQCRA